jgi:hypothetical protein
MAKKSPQNKTRIPKLKEAAVKIIRVNVRLIEANLRQWQRQDGKPFLPAPKKGGKK